MLSGLSLYLEFITKEEEQDILVYISKLSPSKKNNYGGRDNIWRYGTSIYKDNLIDGKIPEWLGWIGERINYAGLLDHVPLHISINQYNKGSFITPHIDNKASGEQITVLSLLSKAVMVMSKKGGEEDIVLEPRSVLVMRGEARWDWKHSIRSVPDTRFSVVFRD